MPCERVDLDGLTDAEVAAYVARHALLAVRFDRFDADERRHLAEAFDRIADELRRRLEIAAGIGNSPGS